MSAPALEKAENEIAEMQKDIETFGKAELMSDVGAKIISEINKESEPFTVDGAVADNPFAKSGGGGGGCMIMKVAMVVMLVVMLDDGGKGLDGTGRYGTVAW
eukprot:CAMPEP_0119542030 /NCGR_PEP_ID=MMETSP1344-20130328/53333_1 /TAXON_ID=236787 /ORGANISM="Florenciella parvula, Strain CCMP2471" /LENGTH=101 /DNA_ID=CAMNT_0007586157 /DNA_START=86 /DNA_END=392 /DNA_ORIENTATION=-